MFTVIEAMFLILVKSVFFRRQIKKIRLIKIHRYQKHYCQSTLKKELKIALLVKGEITITKGWNTWKNMVAESKNKMEEYDISFIFAGTQMDDKTKLHVVNNFDSMQALGKFRYHDELTERRRKVGAVVESGIQVSV